MFKPTPSTSFGFGSTSTTTPFGQSSFGKIGSTSGFGSGAFGATSAPMFGGQTQTNTGLFGQPSTTAQTAFGQPTTAQTGFAFGAPSTSTNLFNQTQQPSSSSLFGSPSNTAFGQKPAFSGFGSSPSTGIFGAAQSAQPQTNPTPLFGQPSTGNTGLFGSTSAFGAPNTQTGTVIKFTPVTGTDTVIKNRITHSISTRHHCITFMKEYEAKSLEELRYEDYLANRKGPQPGTSTGNNLFVPMATPTVGSSTLFGSTPAVSQGFGQTPSVFGQPQTSNLFGQKQPFGATASTSSPFSFSSSATTTPFGNTGAKPFGTAAPTTGLFSTAATQSTSTFGQTNTFGNFGAQTSNATTGFLNQNKPAAGTFNINPTNTTGFGTFGQQQSNLFGGAKPAANVFGTSTGFGQSTTTQPTFGSFGQPQQQSSLLFNNPTFNKPTTGFGVTQPTNTGLLGGFGTGQNQATTNLFGTKTTSSIFGGTQSQTNTMPFSGFGQNTTGTGFGPLLGQPTQLSTQSLFPQQNTSTLSIHEQIVTMARPYPEISFLKNISRTSSNKSRTTNQALLQKVLDDELKVSSKPQKIFAKVRNILPNAGMKTLFDGLEPHDSSLSENIFANKPRNPRRLYLKKFPKTTGKQSFDGNISTDTNETTAENISNSSNTWISNLGKIKDVSLAESCDNNTSQENEDRDQNSNVSEIKMNESSDPLKISKELPVTNLSETTVSSIPIVSSTTASNNNQYAKEITLQSTPESDNDNVDDSEKSSISSSAEPHPAGIICTRAGYYTIPSLDELAKMTTSDGRCIVETFTIGRKGYGNVHFPESFDVSGINIDQHVHFRTKELIIYVDDENKPPMGQELNRPAQVTLDQVYPRDRITRELITDVDRLTEMGFENILRETCNRHGTEFIDYRPETGSWVFKVDHFTRYGFSDDDANSTSVLTTNEQKKTAELIQKQKVNIPPLSDEILRLDSDKDDSDLDELHPEDSESLLMGPPGDIYTDRLKKRTTRPNSANNQVLSMRQAFFGDNASIDNGSIASSQVSGGILSASRYVDYLTEQQQKDYMREFFTKMYQDPDLELESAEHLDAMLRYKLQHEELMVTDTVATPSSLSPFESAVEMAYDAPQIVPEFIRDDIMIAHQIGFVQLHEFLQIFNSTKCKYDISIFKANGFRTSFNRGHQFFIMNQWNQKFTLFNQTFNQSMLYLNDECQYKEIPDLLRLSFVFEDYKCVDTFKKNIQEHLLVQQAHGDIEIDSNGFPYAFPLEGPKALHEHSEKARKQYKSNRSSDFIVHYSVHLWKLFEALWGEILELELENPDDHLTTSTRRKYFSNWLESYMEEILRVKEFIHPEKITIYDYVVAHKLSEASKFAFNKKSPNLSLLITNLTPNIGLRSYGNSQITLWKTGDYGKFIDKQIIKLYLLLAGLPITVINKNMKINVCENLNWLEAFALHLWYLTPIELTITDVTNDYLRAFMEDAYAEPPFPLYTLNRNEQLTSNIPIYDLIYHLVRLYSDRTYSLETLLNPANYTADPTDYSLSWLALNNLKALGYTHIREISETKIHERFASQLEREGLWHWSLFVLLHIKSSTYRKKLVVEMINRNVSIDFDDDEYLSRETFAIKELSIASKYFSRAKGYKALSEHDYNVAINHFIASNDAKLVTKIFWEHIAPKEMMNRNYDYIKSLLESMIEAKYAGDLHLILYDFIQIVSPIVELFVNGTEVIESFDNKNIEDITLSLSNICNKLLTVEINTKQQCLIISEISRDIVNYIKIILNSLKTVDKRPLAVLAVWASKLPLPDDYTIEEIKDATCLLIQLIIDIDLDET